MSGIGFQGIGFLDIGHRVLQRADSQGTAKTGFHSLDQSGSSFG